MKPAAPDATAALACSCGFLVALVARRARGRYRTPRPVTSRFILQTNLTSCSTTGLSLCDEVPGLSCLVRCCCVFGGPFHCLDPITHVIYIPIYIRCPAMLCTPAVSDLPRFVCAVCNLISSTFGPPWTTLRWKWARRPRSPER